MAASRKPAAVRGHEHRRRVELERAASRDWKREATRGGCVMCRAYPVTDPQIRRSYAVELRDIQGHHIIEKSALKNHGKREYIWDARNGMGLCGYHHPRHTHWRQRVPRELLPPAVYEFADEIGLQWLLDQYLQA